MLVVDSLEQVQENSLWLQMLHHIKTWKDGEV